MPAELHARMSSRKRRVPPALLALAGVADLLGVGLSTAERLKAAGKIGPRPVRFAGPKWNRFELLAWINNPDPGGELLDVFQWAAVRDALYPQARAKRASG